MIQAWHFIDAVAYFRHHTYTDAHVACGVPNSSSFTFNFIFTVIIIIMVDCSFSSLSSSSSSSSSVSSSLHYNNEFLIDLFTLNILCNLPSLSIPAMQTKQTRNTRDRRVRRIRKEHEIDDGTHTHTIINVNIFKYITDHIIIIVYTISVLLYFLFFGKPFWLAVLDFVYLYILKEFSPLSTNVY